MKERGQIGDASKWIKEAIRDFINKSPENTLRNPANEKAWDEPLVGFSRGDDPLYQQIKEMIGDFYWTPLEIFRRTFPDTQATADQLTVISWILPQTEATKADNRQEKTHPSERWARSRFFGEEVNEKLRRHVVSVLQEAGYKALAPMQSPLWKRMNSERYGIASTWSERHTAYTSGLGTFGLSDGLITPKGKAMRCGSVIAQIQIPATPRPYRDHHAYCLFYSQGKCGRCITRCPAKAITKQGHDKEKCETYIKPMREYVKNRFGFDGYGCGLCQTAVPCESKIPTEKDVK